MRTCWFVAFVSLAIVACSSPTASAPASVRESAAALPLSESDAPPAEQSDAGTPEASSTGPVPGEVPYEFVFPEGWISLTTDPTVFTNYLEDLKKTNPDEAASLADAQSNITDQFAAVNVEADDDGISPSVGCNTVSTGGLSGGQILDLAEQQNVESIAAVPGISQPPVADRFLLPVGETLRVRWQGELAGPPEVAAIGYAFVVDDLFITCVFQSLPDTIAAHEPEFESILRTFKLRETN